MVRVLIAVFLTIIFFEGSAQKSKSNSSSVLFTVKDEQVSSDEFIYLYKKNHPNSEDFTPEKIEEYLKLYVNFKLKVQEARQRGMDTTAAFLKEYNSYKEELKKPYLPEGKILDSLVQITYKRLQEEVRVSHILINLKPDTSPADSLEAYNKAIEIKERALKGEDFASLAALYSEEPMVQTTKGDLGYFTALQMVYPFENAAYQGKKGDIVGPVRTRFGYHVLKIVDRKPARGEVEVSHIMIRTGTERDDAKSKNLIFEIYDQLKGGVAWNELCKEHSEDPASKNNGGKLRPFGLGPMAAIPTFERAAFALQNPGDISDPFQTQYGWHIVKLERKIPLPPLEELASNLRGRVARDERTQVSKQALITKLKRDFSFLENQEVKTKVLALADTSLTRGRWKWKQAETSAINSKTLFSLSSKPVLAIDFLNEVKKSQKPSALTPRAHLEQLYNAFVENKINEKLEAKIIREHPDFELLLKEYYEGILLFEIMEKEVWVKANQDSLGQVKYFQANAKKYEAGERADAVIYYSPSAEIISSTKKNIEKKDTLAIEKAFQAKSWQREAGVFQQEDRPVLPKVEWKPGLYSVEHSRIYYLVHIKKMVAPGPLTFEEARAKVISDYQDDLEKTWLDQLAKKYPVKINEKARKYVLEKLKS